MSTAQTVSAWGTSTTEGGTYVSQESTDLSKTALFIHSGKSSSNISADKLQMLLFGICSNKLYGYWNAIMSIKKFDTMRNIGLSFAL